MHLSEILSKNCIVLDVVGESKEDIMACLSEALGSARSDIDSEELRNSLMARERASSTAVADGIAIPHAKIDIRNQVLCVFGRSVEGKAFDSMDGRPTKLFFVLVSPKDENTLHLRWLAHIASLLKDEVFRGALVEANSEEKILDVFHTKEVEAARQS